jgi:class 3 adenylate cyclase
MECPSCHSDTPDTGKFCIICGSALESRCRSCGCANRPSAKFRAECGTPLTASALTTREAPLFAAASPIIPVAASAERRQLTILICDLVGSTALSARLDPEDMGEIIGAYHRCCAEQIAKADGFVAKYMGDGALAYFGYPQAHEDDAERGVRTALGLTEEVAKLHTGHEATLQVRIGIATGLVVVGDLVGTGEAQERGVVGETPNLASRLQALAEPGQVVISHSTRRLSAGLFEYRDLGKVTLKGLADPVQAWCVTGTSTVPSRFEAQHETNLTPMVGRDEELELLLRRWQRARLGEGQVVLLSGEPGIGKSRLSVALEERLQDDPHARVQCFCSPHHTDTALYPTIAQLERAAGFERDDAPKAKLDKLASLLGPSSGHENDTQLLSELLSIPTSDSYTTLNWTHQRKKEKTFDALLRHLQMLSQQRPVFMVYEDIQWIDPSSRELLDMIVERVASLPVLLIITFRPEFGPPWIGQAHVSTLTLRRLGRREGGALVERVAGSNALPEEIMAEIVERADGIPLFAEELTKAVLDEAATESASAAQLRAIAVPATLHASLMARLDRLGPVARETAQVGAAIGREFSYQLIAAVADRSDGALRSGLDQLVDAGLILRRGSPPNATFLFKHALVQDSAYGTLLKTRRQHLHARIAQMLVERLPDQASVRPELVASHYAQAGVADQAIDYWDKAGRLAVARSAMAEAVVHFGKALRLLADLPKSHNVDPENLPCSLLLLELSPQPRDGRRSRPVKRMRMPGICALRCPKDPSLWRRSTVSGTCCTIAQSFLPPVESSKSCSPSPEPATILTPNTLSG